MTTLSLIDTHNHVDCPRFQADRRALVEQAQACGVKNALICAGFPAGFDQTRSTAHQFGWHYALGIHPLWLPDIEDIPAALQQVRLAVTQALSDPLFAAIGEIGLDFYVKDLDRARQEELFLGQLKIARDFQLPVSVHARYSVDAVSAGLRRIGVHAGVIHAFNGSLEQAQRFIRLGFKLGFGGAMMYSGSLRIRKILTNIPADSWVLETDCPDMPSPARRSQSDQRTNPADITTYLQEAATLRGISPEQACKESTENAISAFPRLQYS